MTQPPAGGILTINTGSSSLKAAIYQVDDSDELDLSVRVERIGYAVSRMEIRDAIGATLFEHQGNLPSHEDTLRMLFDWFREHYTHLEVAAVGHRVVHGGSHYYRPQFVTDELIEALRKLIMVAPEHLPQSIDAIEAARAAFRGVPQVACFDTAFHRRMPHIAQIYPLPRRYQERGILRYGFHGLSYEYIVDEMRTIDPDAADGRLIVAHLGNGASMAAIRGGVGIDTTMGFTPAGGLMMGTRTGDLDPGVLLYLMRTEHMSADGLGKLVNEHGGLLGVSGVSADMRDLLDRESSDRHASEAIELFCYQARKFLGSMTAVLGGVDTLVFSGGIGERAWSVRQRICTGLEFIGLHLDAKRNASNAPIISSDTSPVTVRVIPTDEDVMIARHTRRLVRHEGENHVSI